MSPGASKRESRTRTAALFAHVVLLVAVTFAACAPASKEAAPRAATGGAELVWPQAPERARIRFVAAVARPKDLGIQPSVWQRVGEFFVGKREQVCVRPTGVAARGSAIYVADPGAQALWILDPEAGRWQAVHEAGEDAFVSPVAVVPGPRNRLFVADSYLAKIVVLDEDGDGVGTIAHPVFKRPAGLAYDAARDRLFVADSGAHTVWIVDGAGRPAGMIGGRGAGTGEFNFPTHVALDRAGGIYVADALNYRLQMFAPDWTPAGAFGRHGDAAGDFASPKGVALDSEGHVYVVDALFDGVQIFDRQGQHLLTFGERGTEAGQFWLPNGIFIDERDRIYVADAYNQRIQIFQYLGGGGDG